MNQKRLEYLNKTIDIQNKMLAYSLDIDKEELAKLFDVDTDTIGLHISNILKENELDQSTTEKSSVVQMNPDQMNWKSLLN